MASWKAKRKDKGEKGSGAGGEGGAAGSDEKFTFFFGAESPFSQWHSAEFTVDGVHYNCAEQYMMHQKAGELCGRQIGSVTGKGVA